MHRATITASEALADALDFTRGVWRRAWGVQLLFALGVAMLFVSVRGRVSTAEASDLGLIGLCVVGVTAAPLAGSLLRLRMGGAALRCLGPFGLQFWVPEARLLAIGLAWIGASLLALLPLVAVSALVFVVLRGAGTATLPALGPIRVSFLVVAAVWFVGLAAWFYATGRLALALPATVGKRRLVLSQAWALGQGVAGPLTRGLALSLAPGLLTLAAFVQLDRIAVLDPDWGALATWPTPDAMLGGMVLGAVASFIQAPMSLGLLAAVYCAQRTRRWRLTRTPRSAGAKVVPFARYAGGGL